MKINSYSLKSQWLPLWLHPSFSSFWFLNMSASRVSFHCLKCSISIYLFWSHKVHLTILSMIISHALLHKITAKASFDRFLSSLLNVSICRFLIMLKYLRTHQMISLSTMLLQCLWLCTYLVIIVG